MKQARVAAGLSQEDLARKLDVSVFTVSRIERGVVKRLSVDTLYTVAGALDVTPSVLLGEAA